MSANKRLMRSSDKMLAGVCGGLAEYFDIDPTIVRLVYAIVTLISAAFPGVIIYILCWMIIPHK